MRPSFLWYLGTELGVGKGGEAEGTGGGKLGGNCGTGVQASTSKPTTFIYTVFEEIYLSYTSSSEMLTYSFTAL